MKSVKTSIKIGITLNFIDQMLGDLGNLQVKKNKGWDQEDKVVSSSNTIFSKERQKPPKTVILLQIVMVSPRTHLVKNHESQSRTNESQ